MPTLDDAPTIAPLGSQKLASAGVFTGGTASPTASQISKTDLFQVYDVSAQRAKTISLNDLAVALGITLA